MLAGAGSSTGNCMSESAEAAMNKQELISKGNEARAAMMGPEYEKRAAARPKNEFSAPFRDLGARFNWGAVWGEAVVDYKTKGFVNIAMLAALRMPHQMGEHIRAAIKNGATPSEIREVLLQTCVYCGVAPGSFAFTAAEAIIEETGKAEDFSYDPGHEPSDGLLEYAKSIMGQVFGEEKIASSFAELPALDKHHRRFKEHQWMYIFGSVWGRGVLPLKTRCFLNIGTMMALSRLRELEVYMRAAIRQGATPDEIYDLLFQAFVYIGVPAAVEGYSIAQRLFDENSSTTN